MKKKTAFISCFVLVAMLIVSFFCASYNNIGTIQAEIKGKEITKYVLTGYQDYYPYHYFDSLFGATYSKKIEYINENGKLVSDFRAILANNDNYFGSDYCKGEASIYLAGEMETLAETGHYYAYASAGLLAFENKDKSKLLISLSNGGVTSTAKSDKVHSGGKYAPDWVKTGKVFLTSKNDVLKFQFSTLEKSTAWLPADFGIFEPTINYGIEIDKITTETKGSTVSNGSLIKLEASHFLSKLFGESLIRYYQNIHEIEWEIVSGAENGQILGNYLSVSGKSGKIVVRPKCLKTTDGTDYIYGNSITFEINSSTVAVSAKSNFDEGVKVSGTGNYNQNRNVVLFLEILDGYSLLRVEDETGAQLSYNVTSSGKYRVVTRVTNQSKNLNIILKKTISVTNIIVKDKVYDKTDLAEIDQIIFDGGDLKHGVTVDLSDLTVKFSSSLPGENIKISISGSLKLSGENAYMYELVGNLPSVTANILKRNIVVRAHNQTIEYGDTIPSLSYDIEGDMLAGEALIGELQVVCDGSIGTYKISIGTLSNSHYNIEFVEGTLTISKRKIEITSIYIDNKTYDKVSELDLSKLHYTMTGSFLKSHNISLNINGIYSSLNAGECNVELSASLNGSDIQYYELIMESTTISAVIEARGLTINAITATKAYGDADPTFEYNYKNSDLLSGDSITGSISRTSGEDVGEYTITQGTLSAANYNIVFNSAKFVITQREISISADAKSKIYGNNDPQLTYSLTNGTIVNNDDLGLTLTRVSGERIGSYAIKIASQINQNYKIYFTSSNLVITQRELNISVVANNKKYDGLLDAEVEIYINNDITADNISLLLTAKFANRNVGYWVVNYYTTNNSLVTEFTSSLLKGQNIDCYKVNFSVTEMANIDKRKIKVTIENKYLSKIFGEVDAGLIFDVENIVEGESLIGTLAREEGENVGFYNILKNTLTEANNPNYQIEYDFDFTFQILKRDLVIVVDDKTIEFGEDEGIIEYYLSSSTPLPLGVELNNILTGAPTRESGKDVGIYNYLIGTLALIGDSENNYNLIFNGGKLTIYTKTLTIQINDIEKNYGSTDPEFTYTVLGKSELVLNIQFVRQVGENVGEYKITGILDDDNYNVVINPGKLTITPAEITIRANSILKIYGDADPVLTYYLSNGMLKFDDRLEDVLTGELVRDLGNSVGVYSIKIGSLKANSNYSLKFLGSDFEIVAKDLYITANKIVKYYDETNEPELTYQVSGLLAGDEIIGSLTRVSGSMPGEYDIEIGTLSAENYNIVFTSAKFVIQKRKITIKINPVSKIFDGTDSAELTYSLSGNILQGSEPVVTLFKESGVNVGKYLINARVEGDIYDVEIITNYFEILKRDVTIRADNFEIVYGEEIPTLTYRVEGDIENSELQISLYRTQSKAAGEYTIYSSILHSDNYNIVYIEGKLTIKKLKLVIKTGNFVKVYGSADPIFDYEIIEGSIVDHDILNGAIIRELGENVGTYKLICELENPNYEIDFLSASLSITRKELTIVTSVMDKVFDGTDIAYLRTPTLAGVINGDDVYFDYERDKVARFIQSAVGDNIAVVVYGGKLSGADCGNYYLTYPTNLTANITNSIVEAEDQKVANELFIKASNSNTLLKQGSTLFASEYKVTDAEKSDFGNSKSIVGAYNLSLKVGNQDVPESGKVTVNIKPYSNGLNNVQVFRLNSDGTKTLLNATYEDGVIKFETDEMGTFIVVADNDNWLNITLIVSASVLLLTIVGFAISKKRKKKKA